MFNIQDRINIVLDHFLNKKIKCKKETTDVDESLFYLYIL